MLKIGFLFNHEQLHQIPHSAPILAALAAMKGDFELHAFVPGQTQETMLRRFLPNTPATPITMHGMAPYPAAVWAERVVGGAIPLRRLGALSRHRQVFAAMDVLVVPETTSIFLKTRFGITSPTFVYSQHGAGDRAVGFKKIIGAFDHVLVCGERVKSRMLDAGIIREGGYHVVGYPKFDAVQATCQSRLFGNENTTVLYNPHFHPYLSSWYRHGKAVLDFFAARPHLNLIVAPHVMLHSRQLHVSTGPFAVEWVRRIANAYRKYPNILIDEGSDASVDMTYTRAADVYLGDVSSQIYEFIERPRPCIFLDSHGASWAGDPNYAHWHMGQVVQSVEDLCPLLGDLSWHAAQYEARQQSAFQKTFGENPYGGADKAASAILSIARTRAC